MKDAFGLNFVQPATTGPYMEGRPAQLLRRPMLLLATVAVAVILSIQAAVANANTERAAAVGYLSLAMVLCCCAWAFWTRVRPAQGTLRVRWSLIAGGGLAAAIGYAPSFIQGFLNTGPARGFQTGCFNTSEALYMLAAVLFFADVARSIVIVDILQGLLFVSLRFNLIYSPATLDHFAINHLIVGQFVAAFLFIVAMVACLGAASRAELRFLRALSWFFGFRLIGFFLSNQVSYTWLHYTNTSLYDVAGPALLAGFALYLLYAGPNGNAADTAPLRPPSLVVRSLMPSFLALVNLMLGLFLLQISVLLAVVAISVSVVCYVARTAMLQAQVMKDKALLQSRNEQLEGLAIRDHLTGIGNRRSLAAAYARLQGAAGGTSLALLLIDIDSFKQANDSHGHLHGDRVLIALAGDMESLAAGVAGSHCARLGGDEFALLLPGVTSQEASALAEKLRTVFSGHVYDADRGRVSLSIGVAPLHAARDLELETLASYADEALYRAKLLGRNRVEVQPVWEPAMRVEDSVLEPIPQGELQTSVI
jgi:diguanylate cyclase (GGDEF)-like protein